MHENQGLATMPSGNVLCTSSQKSQLTTSITDIEHRQQLDPTSKDNDVALWVLVMAISRGLDHVWGQIESKFSGSRYASSIFE
jgi:hypothetical protein